MGLLEELQKKAREGLATFNKPPVKPPVLKPTTAQDIKLVESKKINNRNSVVSSYQSLLGRTPSESEIKFWEQQPVGVNTGIKQSDEFKKKTQYSGEIKQGTPNILDRIKERLTIGKETIERGSESIARSLLPKKTEETLLGKRPMKLEVPYSREYVEKKNLEESMRKYPTLTRFEEEEKAKKSLLLNDPDRFAKSGEPSLTIINPETGKRENIKADKKYYPILEENAPAYNIVFGVFGGGGIKSAKGVSKNLLPLAEKAKGMTKEAFLKQFNDGLKSQNLTVRETAQNILKEIKKSDLTLESFYQQAKGNIKPTVLKPIQAQEGVKPKLKPADIARSPEWLDKNAEFTSNPLEAKSAFNSGEYIVVPVDTFGADFGGKPSVGKEILSVKEFDNPQYSEFYMYKPKVQAQEVKTTLGKQNLTQEAYKYKSAEEFVKAQGEPIYHGTSLVNAENINKKGFSLTEQGYSGKPIGASNKGEGLSFSKKQSVSELHAIGSVKGGKGGTVLPVFIDKNAKIFSTKDIPKEWQGEFLTRTELDTYARTHGFDGIDLAKLEGDGIIRGGKIGVKEYEVDVWNKDVVKTKSQLTDIWNKAQEGVKGDNAVTRFFDKNFNKDKNGWWEYSNGTKKYLTDSEVKYWEDFAVKNEKGRIEAGGKPIQAQEVKTTLGKPKALPYQNTPDTELSLKQLVQKNGGINYASAEKSGLRGELDVLTKAEGGGNIIRKNGGSNLSTMAERAHELGFMESDDGAELIMRLQDDIRGKPTYHIGSAKLEMSAEKKFIKDMEEVFSKEEGYKISLDLPKRQKRMKKITEAIEEFEMPQLTAKTKNIIKDNKIISGIDIKDVKPISGFKAGFRDVYRNFRVAFGKNFDQVKVKVLDPFDKSKGEMVDEIQFLTDDLYKNVVKGMNIRKGSKASALVQKFGEKKLVYDDIVKQVGKDKADDIVKADSYFRQQYDRLIDEVNIVRKEIYPNSPEKWIPKRKDYYRHFQEMSEGISGLKNIFETPAGIPAELASISRYTKPKSKFLSFAQQRTGDKTTYDAVGGFIDYTKSFAYAKHIDPNIGVFRRLAKQLRDVGGKEKGYEQLISYIDDFANQLSGKTVSHFDRFIQQRLPGGRQGLAIVKWVNNRTKANIILGNMSSSLAQLANLPQGVANAGAKNSIKGFGRTLLNVLDDNKIIKNSDFIKERYSGKIFNKFNTKLLDNPKKMAVWITQVLDDVATKIIWNSHYYQGIDKGVANPIKYADDTARSLVAGRGIGEVPIEMSSDVGKIIAPFMVEVNNLWFVFGDWIGKKEFGKFVSFAIASWIYNEGLDKTRGSRVSIDPIEAARDAYTIYQEEKEFGTGTPKSLALAGGRVGGEVLGQIPFGANIAGATMPEEMRTRYLGQADPTRFKTGGLALLSPAQKALKDKSIIPLLTGYGLPFGGKQVERTIQGGEALLEGEVQTSYGNKVSDIEATPTNIAKGLTLGQYSLPEVRGQFKEQEKITRMEQRETEESRAIKQKAKKEYQKMQEMDKEEKKNRLLELAKTDEKLVEKILDEAETDALGLTSSERAVKNLGVENGSRAKYIYDKTQGMSKKEMGEYLLEMSKKKILTENVMIQLLELKGL